MVSPTRGCESFFELNLVYVGEPSFTVESLSSAMENKAAELETKILSWFTPRSVLTSLLSNG